MSERTCKRCLKDYDAPALCPVCETALHERVEKAEAEVERLKDDINDVDRDNASIIAEQKRQLALLKEVVDAAKIVARGVRATIEAKITQYVSLGRLLDLEAALEKVEGK